MTCWISTYIPVCFRCRFFNMRLNLSINTKISWESSVVTRIFLERTGRLKMYLWLTSVAISYKQEF